MTERHEPSKYAQASALVLRGLRILDAANYMGANPYFVEALIRSRELPAIKLGRLWIILREDVDAYLDRRRAELKAD